MSILRSALFALLLMGIVLILWQIIWPESTISRVWFRGREVSVTLFFAAISVLIFIALTALIWFLLRKTVP
ncbi:MAG: hypothetical protein L0Z53_24275 [Acidobacteriales bacterium]|nr:hypothetical protein [Terriglobales bacterium]